MADISDILRDESVQAVFWSKVDKRGPDECWPWLGAVMRRDQRGTLGFGRKTWMAPALALVLADRPQLHQKPFACHSCDNPNCVNPSHLWWGTHQDNMTDAKNKGRIRGQSQTHCKRGHPLSGDNVATKPNGWRSCRVCQRIHSNKSAQRPDAKLAKAESQRRRAAEIKARALIHPIQKDATQ